MVKKFDFDQLSVLAHLGLWEHAEFYGAERYPDLTVLYRTIDDYLQFTYNSNYTGPINLYPSISVPLDLNDIT